MALQRGWSRTLKWLMENDIQYSKEEICAKVHTAIRDGNVVHLKMYEMIIDYTEDDRRYATQLRAPKQVIEFFDAYLSRGIIGRAGFTVRDCRLGCGW